MDRKKVSKRPKESKRSKVSKRSKASKESKRSKSGKLKVLPLIDPKGPHLTEYGYDIHKSQSEREKSLIKASKKVGVLEVLRRLNLIRNYTAVESNKKKMSKDVEFMKKFYEVSKKISLSKK